MVDAKTISGVMNLAADTTHKAVPSADTFSYPASPIYLPAGASVSL